MYLNHFKNSELWGPDLTNIMYRSKYRYQVLFTILNMHTNISIDLENGIKYTLPVLNRWRKMIDNGRQVL